MLCKKNVNTLSDIYIYHYFICNNLEVLTKETGHNHYFMHTIPAMLWTMTWMISKSCDKISLILFFNTKFPNWNLTPTPLSKDNRVTEAFQWQKSVKYFPVNELSTFCLLSNQRGKAMVYTVWETILLFEMNKGEKLYKDSESGWHTGI